MAKPERAILLALSEGGQNGDAQPWAKRVAACHRIQVRRQARRANRKAEVDKPDAGENGDCVPTSREHSLVADIGHGQSNHGAAVSMAAHDCREEPGARLTPRVATFGRNIGVLIQ